MTINDLGQAWEQVRVEADQQLAERLEILLGKIIPGGIVIEKNYGDLFPHELEEYQGPVWLYGYYPLGQSQEVKKRIADLLDPALYHKLEFIPIEERDWTTAWQERYRPIPVGDNLVIVPTWLENPHPGRMPIWMDPGMAFGSGTHPTTQLSLAMMEEVIRDSQPGEMIDVGCGSGILSIAAAKMGVKSVLGVDVDPDAVRITKMNAAENRVSKAITCQEGSVAGLLDRGEDPFRAPLVVSNIIAPILMDLFNDGLGELVCPGGRIILSGILAEQVPGILSCLERSGFEDAEQHQRGEWVGLVAERKASA